MGVDRVYRFVGRFVLWLILITVGGVGFELYDYPDSPWWLRFFAFVVMYCGIGSAYKMGAF